MTEALKRRADDVFELVTRELNVQLADVLGDKRMQNLVDARVIISVILRENLGISLTQIGSLLNKNHSTIIHYGKRLEQVDPIIKAKFYKVKKAYDAYKLIPGSYYATIEQREQLYATLGKVEFQRVFSTELNTSLYTQRTTLINQIISINKKLDNEQKRNNIGN